MNQIVQSEPKYKIGQKIFYTRRGKIYEGEIRSSAWSGYEHLRQDQDPWGGQYWTHSIELDSSEPESSRPKGRRDYRESANEYSRPGDVLFTSRDEAKEALTDEKRKRK